MNRKFLVIQTAFLGDVILSTAVAEKLYERDPSAKIDMLVRKGNESVFQNHPFIRSVLVWDKKSSKYANLFRLLMTIRRTRYDVVVNLQRFAASGFLTAFSGAKETTGFRKNPFSFLFTHRMKHLISADVHETDRNQSTIAHLAGKFPAKPHIYPSEQDYSRTAHLKSEPYITISPVSVWHTKTFPAYKWMELVREIYESKSYRIYLLGSAPEYKASEYIRIKSEVPDVINLCGKLSVCESAALMRDAKMNYVNDSAPLHLASAINAPVTAIFCSTIPEFGFGPLSDNSTIIQTESALSCRPCGLHGFRECPLVHFKCAHTIGIGKNLIP
jgi:heptosyltransferase-2